MKVTYETNELARDIRSLAGKDRITADVAKELAEFKQIIDCAAHTWYDLSAADEVNVPEKVFDAFDLAHTLLEEAYYQIIEFFPQEEPNL